MLSSADTPWLKKAILVASFVLALTIFYMAILSSESLPDHRLIRGYNDLVMHFLAFGALVAVCLLGLAPRVACIWSGVFAIVIEAAQLFVPSRSASIPDLLAGWAGILLVALVFLFARRIVGPL